MSFPVMLKLTSFGVENLVFFLTSVESRRSSMSWTTPKGKERDMTEQERIERMARRAEEVSAQLANLIRKYGPDATAGEILRALHSKVAHSPS